MVKPRILVIRAPGTNCDIETAGSIKRLGVDAPIVHIKRILNNDVKITDYDGLVIPGGFSYGDHVRAGALLGKLLHEKFQEALFALAESKAPILGICNGFQVLVECGLLPGNGLNAALATNENALFQCRWVSLEVTSDNCIFTKGLLNKTISLPIANGEGRFLVDETTLSLLKRNGQVILRYSQGKNPNGSIDNIAGISDKGGTVFGLMPHPERAIHGYTHPNWTRSYGPDAMGTGSIIFQNMVDQITK